MDDESKRFSSRHCATERMSGRRANEAKGVGVKGRGGTVRLWFSLPVFSQPHSVLIMTVESTALVLLATPSTLAILVGDLLVHERTRALHHESQG